jgi:hypothetical protein
MTSTIDKAVKNNTGFRYIHNHLGQRRYSVTIDDNQRYFSYGPRSPKTREQAFTAALEYRNSQL